MDELGHTDDLREAVHEFLWTFPLRDAGHGRQIVRDSHWLQRQVLARWENEEGKLSWWRLTNPYAKPIPKSANRVAFEKGIFLTEVDGLPEDATEQLFTHIEKEGLEPLDRFTFHGVALKGVDRIAASAYLAMALTRSHGWRAEHSRWVTKASLEVLEENRGVIDDHSLEAMIENHRQQFASTTHLRHLEKLTCLFHEMKWLSIHAVGTAKFIVGDRHGVLVDSYPIGEYGGMGRVAHVVPMSPKAAVTLTPTRKSTDLTEKPIPQSWLVADAPDGHPDEFFSRELHIIHDRGNLVTDINLCAMAQSENYVAGSDPALLSNLKKLLPTDAAKRWEFESGKPLVGCLSTPRVAPVTGDIAAAVGLSLPRPNP